MPAPDRAPLVDVYLVPLVSATLCAVGLLESVNVARLQESLDELFDYSVVLAECGAVVSISIVDARHSF